MDRQTALALFLDALDEWGCEDNAERSRAIWEFIDDGCDLSEYKENARHSPGGRRRALAQEGE